MYFIVDPKIESGTQVVLIDIFAIKMDETRGNGHEGNKIR